MRKQRILLDTTSDRTAAAGVRAHVRGMRRTLRSMPAVSLREVGAPVPAYSSKERVLVKAWRHLVLLFWYQAALPVFAYLTHAEVLICPEYYSPFGAPCPRVVVFHDTLFWDRPEYPRWWKALLHLTAVLPSRKASAIVTPSKAVIAGVSRITGKAIRDIWIMPSVIERHDYSAEAAALTTLGLKPGYLLHVGALEKRKNIPALVRAYAEARGSDPGFTTLVLAGPRSPIAALDDYGAVSAAIKHAGLEGSVVVTGRLTDAQIWALYKGAVALVFQSRAEGFGLPLVEAMVAQVPVVAVDSAATRDVTRGAALLIDADDPEALSSGIKRVVNDVDLRRELVRRGLTVAEHYSLRRAVDRMERLLAEVTPGE